MDTPLDEHIQQFAGQYRRTSYEERLLSDMRKAKALIEELSSLLEIEKETNLAILSKEWNS